MSQDNHITLRGYLTSEPKFRQTAQTGTPMTEIRLGSTPRRLNRETGEWQDQPTSYYTIKCWRRLAINASSSLHKGDMVVVRGHFYTRTWLDNQQRHRSVLEIEADSLGHDLSFGWSHFLRGSRPLPGGPAAVNAGELARQDLGDQDEAGGEFSSGGDLEEFAEASFAPGDQADPDDPGYQGDVLGELAATLGTPAADTLDRVLLGTKSDTAVPDAESLTL
jgi:single-strand DNA-binding protein